MALMILLMFSRLHCFIKDELEGTIASVVMEDVGIYCMFVEGGMVINKDWLYIALKLIEDQRLD